jgi:hypothetical protein
MISLVAAAVVVVAVNCAIVQLVVPQHTYTHPCVRFSRPTGVSHRMAWVSLESFRGVLSWQRYSTTL